MSKSQNYISGFEILKIPYYPLPDNAVPVGFTKGNNRSQVLVLVRATDIPDHLPLLKKILRSIDCDLEEDVAFAILQESETYPIMSDPSMKDNKIICIFGIPPERIGTATDRERGVLRFETTTVIAGPSLEEMSKKPAAKRQLWGFLKEVFHS